MQKIIKPMSGFRRYCFPYCCLSERFSSFASSRENTSFAFYGLLAFLASLYLSLGIIVISPNHSRVLTFFGKYVGTVKDNGLLFVNPLYKKQKISLRSENLGERQTKSKRQDG